MKYLCTFLALCFCVLNFSIAHADSSTTDNTPTHQHHNSAHAYEWSDGNYAPNNNLVIENITTADIPCFGGTRGTVTIEVSGATPDITYDIGVAGTATVIDETYTFFQSLDAGTYDLTVTDGDGCMAFDVFTIDEPPPLLIASTPIAETLPGTNDGSITICVQGGTPPYFVTSPAGVSVVDLGAGTCSGNYEVSNIGAGTYDFIVQDANGCTAGDLVTVDAGTCIGDVTSSVSTNNTLSFCKDAVADTVSMENSIGGMVGDDYAYVLTDANDVIILWNPSANFYNANQLMPGIYRIYGFSYQGVLNVPVGMSVNDITSTPDCISLSDNFVEVELFAPPSNAVAGADIALCGPSMVGLSADSVAVGTGVWTQVSGAQAVIADGNMSTTAVSGLMSGLYEFEWSVSNGVCPPSRDTVEVLIVDTAIHIDTITIVDETCSANNDGSATVSVSGALPPITYDIGNEGLIVTIEDTSYTFMSSLAAGDYTITVTDAAGCFALDSFSIGQPDSLYIQSTVMAESQVGMNDGSISLCVKGEPPFSLSSSPNVTITDLGVGICDGNYEINGLEAGTYVFDIEDANGCTDSETVVVAPGDCAIRIDSVVVNSDVSCFEGSNGQLTVYAEGSSNYQFSIDNGATYTAAPSSLSFINLEAGSYEVVVVDDLGCRDTFANNPILVNGPIDFTVSDINAMNVSAPGANNGQIDFCVNGAVPPYSATYQGMDTNTSGTFSAIVGACAGNFITTNLPGDTYTVEITDANGCKETFEVFVDDVDCSPFSIVGVQPTNVACNGESTGAIQITTSGGFNPHTFIIDNGTDADTVMVNADNYTFNDLPEGGYSLTAIHSGDCVVQSNTFITGSSAVSAGISTIDPTEINSMDGEICINPVGGAMSYTVTSDCGNPVEMAGTCGGSYHISGLGAGECTITIVDDNGCIYSTTAELFPPSCNGFSLVNVTPADVSCAGANDGLITIAVNGGEPIYRYSIDGGNNFIENTNNEYTFENVGADTYDIVVEDGQGCEVSFTSVTITEPLPISIEIETTATCAESNDGGIDITPSGGTGAYTYMWGNSSIEQDIDQLPVGSYDLTITDANACMFESTIQVAAFSTIELNLGGNQIIDANDSIQLMPNISAMQGYTHTWSPTTGLGDTTLTPWANPQTTTTYTLTLTSDEGCVFTDEIIISVNPVRQVVAVPSAFTPNGDSENDVLNVIVQGDFELIGFHVFNRWGEEIFFSDNQSTGWDGTYKGELQPVGTYVYIVEYEDTSGANTQKGGDVTLLR